MILLIYGAMVTNFVRCSMFACGCVYLCVHKLRIQHIFIILSILNVFHARQLDNQGQSHSVRATSETLTAKKRPLNECLGKIFAFFACCLHLSVFLLCFIRCFSGSFLFRRFSVKKQRNSNFFVYNHYRAMRFNTLFCAIT